MDYTAIIVKMCIKLLLEDIQPSRPKNRERAKAHVIPLEHGEKRDNAALRRPNFKGMNKNRRTRQKKAAK